MHRTRLRALALLLSFCLAAQAQVPSQPAQQARPYVLLVALGGFRYDYARKYGAKHLSALAAAGAVAEQGMIPAYPSLTLPNLYTLVTGLYPQHHGIVADKFYDPTRKQSYGPDSDGSWYGGTPLWVLAEKQGVRTASLFWPGSQVEIEGSRPTYSAKTGDSLSDQKRIDQGIAWLQLPDAQRPHFIALYLAAVDQSGREYGPDSPQTAAAVTKVDQQIGDLWAKLNALQLPIDLFVLSDHGMEREQGPWMDLSQYANLAAFTTVGSLLYSNSEAAAEKAYQELKIKTDAFTVYRRKRVPASLHSNNNPRMGDPVIVANGPYALRARPDGENRPPDPGVYGYDPRAMPSMRALFVAAGPDIRPGIRLEPFESVNIYPLLAKILSLDAPQTDGTMNVLSKILKPSPIGEIP
jgi:predicted AlkP superfamily pyrophosphatase or phosphodiesterase